MTTLKDLCVELTKRRGSDLILKEGRKRVSFTFLRLKGRGRAERFRQPAGAGKETLGFGRHLLLLETGKQVRRVLPLGFYGGVEDLLLRNAAEIIGGGGDEALRAHIEFHSFRKLQRVAALVRACEGFVQGVDG